jgi:cell wall-associated NlpC family hydrolase
LHTQNKAHPGYGKLKATVALAAVAAVAALSAIPAQAGNGGTGASATPTGPRGHAKLVHGKAIPPSNAPRKVVRVIKAANRIRSKPYVYGGGHGSWRDNGYDCSGSVSYALHGGRLLGSPLDSSGFMHWARRGKGHWITVYSNPSHAFMVVAGLRFDTSMTAGNGPGWSKNVHAERLSDFRKRHKRHY